jgi:hypothetical protein
MLDLLTSSRSVSADAEESSIKAATLLKELMANLKKVATLAGDLDSDLLFLRYALDISLEYKLEKSTLPTKEQIRKDIEAAVTTFPLFEDAVYEFYFPYASSVRLESLKTESVPYLLQKIQKHATRAGDAIRSLEASGKIK